MPYRKVKTAFAEEKKKATERLRRTGKDQLFPDRGGNAEPYRYEDRATDQGRNDVIYDSLFLQSLAPYEPNALMTEA